MNILFALYKEGETNSGIHVACLAQALNRIGNDCVIAVPESESPHAPLVKGVHAPRMLSFTQVEQQAREACLFPDGRGADIFHAWTPREVVRLFHERMKSVCTGRLIIHMEDNEDELVRHFLGEATYRNAAAGQFHEQFPVTLTHPLTGRTFIAESDGATLLAAAMRDMLPADTPAVVMWPAADDRIYFPRPTNTALRTALGLPPDAIVLVYTGNGHPANCTEICSLYLAVHLLNRRGIPARLVRTGVDVFAMDDDYRAWAHRYSIELGHVPERSYLGDLLAMADVLVQPGVPGPFNDMRFPSKLPEYLASGRPVVLPRTNIGLVTRHLQDAYVLDRADGPSIADAIEAIMQDTALQQALASGARAFYEAHFSWARSAETVDRFYREIMGCNRSRGSVITDEQAQ